MSHFRARIVTAANQILQRRGRIDPARDGKDLAAVVRNDSLLLAAYLDDHLEQDIRAIIRKQFPPTRDRPHVGGQVVDREAIRAQVHVRAQQHPSMPQPAPSRTITIEQLRQMTKPEVTSLARDYARSGARDIVIANWLRRIDLLMDDSDTTVGSRFTDEGLKELFSAAKTEALAQPLHDIEKRILQ
jgi:hypothetical protein